MAAQMNYGYDTPKGIPGGKVDLSFDHVVTRLNEEADGVMKFGMAVVAGTSAGTDVKKPATGATAATFEGVVLHGANTERDMTGAVVIKNNASLSVMKKGRVWGRLATGATATYGATAYVVISGEDAGTFTNTSDSTAIDVGAKFGEHSDDGIAVIVLK